MSAFPVLPGAEAWSASGGPAGALVVHGFTGSPQSMRGLAEAFASAGFTVELPRLPGHGTSVEDMANTGWADWSAAVADAYASLHARCPKVVVAGLSMGGTLCLWLAGREPAVAGVVAINAAVGMDDAGLRQGLNDLLAAGTEIIPGVGGDIAEQGVTELAYESVPVRSLLSFGDAMNEVEEGLARIACPVLVMNSPQDHVVPPTASDLIASRVAGPVERVTLDRSFHVATLDFDRGLIEERAVEFGRKVTAG
jgi:carboxylesterase